MGMHSRLPVHHIKAMRHYEGIVKVLLENGAEVNAMGGK